MRFNWTEEQTLLRHSVRKYLDDRYSAEYRRRRVTTGFDAQVWSELSDMGVLGLPFAEEHGGSGGTALDTLLVSECFGRALLLEPYLPTVVLGGGLLRLAASQAQQSELIPQVIAGQLRLSLAFAEEQSRFNTAQVTTTAKPVGNDFVIDGRKIVVFGAPEAHRLFVTARTSGNPTSPQGVSLFLIPSDASGMSLRSYQCLDATSAAEVTFSRVRVSRECLIGALDAALPVVDRVLDQAIAALCGEAVGAMGALLERCVDYVNTRHAFGKPIGQFQVIGHRVVDMHVAYEQASAIAIKAASKLAANAPDAARSVAACKVSVGTESVQLGKQAVQLHGAMGITEELDVGQYFKRIMAIQTMFGSTRHHVRRYAELDTTAA